MVQVVPVGQTDVVPNGPAIVEWLEANPLPARLQRSPEEIDAQIAALHLAVAQLAGCEALWTNDKRLATASRGLAVDVLND